MTNRARAFYGLLLGSLLTIPAFSAEEIIVRFKDGVTLDQQKAALETKTAKARFTAERPAFRPAARVPFDKRPDLAVAEVKAGKTVKQTITDLKANPNVLYVGRNYLLKKSRTPNDFYFKEQYGLHNTGQYGEPLDIDIDAPEAWNITTGDRNVVVAIIDSGIDYTHEDIRQNIWINTREIATNNIDDDGNGFVDDVHGYDFSSCQVWGETGCDVPKTRDGDPMDEDSHGTHVAGIVGAVTDNGIGVAGVAWNVRLMAVRFITNTGSLFDMVDGLRYAVANGANIINISAGAYFEDADIIALMQDEVNAANAAGVVVVGAAGNETMERIVYPAGLNHVISVGAIDYRGMLATFSNYGAGLDLLAPGEQIGSTVNPNTYQPFRGTSMSAPFVSGTAALIKSKFPSATPDQIADRIIKSADNVDQYNPTKIGKMGSGTLNAYRALTEDPTLRLRYAGQLIKDIQYGINDGKINPGEKFNLIVQLSNAGDRETGIVGTITSTDPRLTILKPTAQFPTMNPGQTADNTLDAMTMSVSASMQLNDQITATLTLRADNGGPTSIEIPLRITATQRTSCEVKFEKTYSSTLEGNVVVPVRVLKNGPGPGCVTVYSSTMSDLPATPNTDYRALRQNICWEDGSSITQTLNLQILDDNEDERDETLAVKFENSSTCLTSTSAYNVTIVDNDRRQIRFTQPSYTFNETDFGVNIPIERIGDEWGAVSVWAETIAVPAASGGAIPGVDYTPQAKELHWKNLPVSPTENLYVPLPDDTLNDGNKTFQVRLSNLVGGAKIVGSNPVTVTIVDDDARWIEFVQSTFTVVEDETYAKVTLRRTGNPKGSVGAYIETVPYSPAPGTAIPGKAISGADFSNLTPIPVDFSEGEPTEKTIQIQIANDRLLEPDETLQVKLSRPLRGAIKGPDTATVVIRDDETLNRPPLVEAGPDQTITDRIGDGRIDSNDFAVWEKANGSQPGQPLWNPRVNWVRSTPEIINSVDVNALFPYWMGYTPYNATFDVNDEGVEKVTLSSTASDPNGSPLTYEWRLGASVLSTNPLAQVVLPVGTHIILLEVKNSRGISAFDNLQIKINPATAATMSVAKVASTAVSAPLSAMSVLEKTEPASSDEIEIDANEVAVGTLKLKASDKSKKMGNNRKYYWFVKDGKAVIEKPTAQETNVHMDNIATIGVLVADEEDAHVAYFKTKPNKEFKKTPEVIVRFKDGVDLARQKNIFSKRKSRVRFTAEDDKRRNRPLMRKGKSLKAFSDLAVAEVEPGKTLKQTIKELKADPNVLYVEPNHPIEAYVTPNDPSFPQLWGLHNNGQFGLPADIDIDAPEAWDITTGDNQVIVAVLDTGIDYNHPDLKANMWTNSGEIPGNNLDDDDNGFIDDVYGYDFATCDNADPVTGICIQYKQRDADPMDIGGHGTHVAGTIGAVGNNAIGVTGVAWKTRLMAVQFLTPGSGNVADLIDAIRYAVNNGASVINISAGGSGYSQILQDEITAAYAAGVVIVAAVGNEGVNAPRYPAALNNVLAVGSLASDGKLSFFSNYGTFVDLLAPGESIYSTTLSNQFTSLNGTSMATPHVTGTLALVKSKFPMLSPDKLVERLEKAADNMDALNPTRAGLIGRGRVNAYRALTEDPDLRLVLVQTTIDDTASNRDGQINPGEIFGLVLSLRNDGAAETNVRATLESTDGRLTITKAAVQFPNMSAGQTVGNNTDPFIILMSPSAQLGDQAKARVTLTAAAGGPITFDILLRVTAVANNTCRIDFPQTEFRVKENVATVPINVARSGYGPSPICVIVKTSTTSDTPATPWTEYRPLWETVCWDGTSPALKTVNLQLRDDSTQEFNETVAIQMIPNTGICLPSDKTVQVVIEDDDRWQIKFGQEAITVDENVSGIDVLIKRLGDTRGSASVWAQIVSVSTPPANTATPGQDFYLNPPKELRWPDGRNFDQAFSVVPMNDLIKEASESFGIRLSSPSSGGKIIGPDTLIVTITDDDDRRVEFTQASFSATENATAGIKVSVRRLGSPAFPMSAVLWTVPYTSEFPTPGRAVTGLDYARTTAQLNWPTGDMTDKSFYIPLFDDGVVEPDETIDVEFVNVTNGVFTGPKRVQAIIVNDDYAPPLLPGDFNLDCIVNGSDFMKWQTDVGKTVIPYTGCDANGDGKVDSADRIIWQTNLGKTCLPASPTTLKTNQTSDLQVKIIADSFQAFSDPKASASVKTVKLSAIDPSGRSAKDRKYIWFVKDCSGNCSNASIHDPLQQETTVNLKATATIGVIALEGEKWKVSYAQADPDNNRLMVDPLPTDGPAYDLKEKPTSSGARVINYKFNPTTAQKGIVGFSVSKDADVIVELYDRTGKKIKELLNTTLPVGKYQAEWDGKDQSGIIQPSGAYPGYLIVDGKRYPFKLIISK